MDIQRILDILIEDQSEQGLRLHKGFPLYWIADSVGKSNKEKALESMLEAFVEDVLTRGHKSFPGFAAYSLKQDFGLSTEALVALKEFVMDKVRFTFYPSLLVAEFLKTRNIRAKESFGGVSEESRSNSMAAQALQKLSVELRSSIKNVPIDESAMQDLVFLVLKQVDPFTEREKTVGKFSGKESKVDFSMGRESIGVEVKLIKEKGQQGTVIDDINADIPPYIKTFRRIIFVVYDACGAISDVGKFVTDLKQDKIEVEILVVKH